MRKWIPAIAALIALIVAAAFLIQVEYAPMPSLAEVANAERRADPTAFDLMGAPIDQGEAARLQQTDEGRALLAPAAGAVPVNDEMRRLGRETFYKETFGNEWFITDVMGTVNGALTPYEVAKALVRLGGRGTTDLKVELAETVTIGSRTYEKGTQISTGIDVPKGGYAPLGIKTVYDRGTIRVGATCALCHATVDEATGKVIEGMPNANLNAGFVLALATNSASYFMHTTIPTFEPYMTDPNRTVLASTGMRERLPDPAALERDVDAMLAAWPPGNFDSTTESVSNPSQITDSFTAHAHPYGWSGFAAVSPFRGLSMLNNNVHGLNADSTTQTLAAKPLFGLDPEVFLGMLMQNAANPRFRFDPASGRKPSLAFAAVDPTPGLPALNEVAPLPTFPAATYIATDSLLTSLPGYPVWLHVNALSAFQNSLLPPQSPVAVDQAVLARGREAFEQAGCGRCHGGLAFTNNRVLPVVEVGTQPSRARALANTERILAPAVMYPFDTPVPVPPSTAAVPVSIDKETLEQLKLAWAHEASPGGYKVKGLIGLAWSAPYLHDGGVAVGPDAARQTGLPGTVYAGVVPDPVNSLRALLDRGLRAHVVAANLASAEAKTSNASGQGHDFYVDETAGFDREQQDALIAYLLSLTRPLEQPRGQTALMTVR